jgi:hypothetical protein
MEHIKLDIDALRANIFIASGYLIHDFQRSSVWNRACEDELRDYLTRLRELDAELVDANGPTTFVLYELDRDGLRFEVGRYPTEAEADLTRSVWIHRYGYDADRFEIAELPLKTEERIWIVLSNGQETGARKFVTLDELETLDREADSVSDGHWKWYRE